MDVFFVRNARVIAAVQLRRYVAGIGVFCIIIDKFSYWKKPYQVILLEVDKNLDVGFYFTVLSFSLIISLRIKGGKKFLFDA